MAMRDARRAVVAALIEGPEGAEARLDEGLAETDRFAAEDLLSAVATRARLIEQLTANALASAFTGDEEIAMSRAEQRALSAPYAAELMSGAKTPARQLTDSYVAAARAAGIGAAEAPVRDLLTTLAREIALMKSAARLAAVQALYQMELSGQPLPKVREQFESLRMGAEIDGARYREADVDLFRRILERAQGSQALIDQTTDRALVDAWPLGRVDATMRALFRAAGAELAGKAAPPKVVISEYVDVAKAFFPDSKEPGMVNAVLDAMAREMRPEAF